VRGAFVLVAVGLVLVPVYRPAAALLFLTAACVAAMSIAHERRSEASEETA